MTDRPARAPTEVDACPKHMGFGPCGGVDALGGCEVDGRPCPFLRVPATEWTGPTRHPHRRLEHRFLVDVRPTGDDDEDRRVAELLGDGAIGLLGEHLDDRTGRPVADQVAELADAGLRCLAAVTGRGDDHRRRIRAIVRAGAVGVLCVTGDHPAARQLGMAVHFATEGTRLAALARQEGAPLVAVAEHPASPPHEGRVDRLVHKQRAGADAVVLNHAGEAADAIAFVDRLHATGTELQVVAPVPVVTDEASATALTQFPGVALPAGYVERIVSSPEPRRAGVAAATELAATLLAHPGIDAVNLSGSATAAGVVERARIMGEVIDALGGTATR